MDLSPSSGREPPLNQPLITPRQIWKEAISGNVGTAVEITNAARIAVPQQDDKRRASTRPIVLYLEPSLSSNIGHQAALAGCYENLFDGFNCQTVVAHAYRCTITGRSGWMPFFLVPHHTLALRPIQTQHELSQVVRYFQEEFQQLVQEYQPLACVFPTVRFTNVVAAARSSVDNDRHLRRIILGVMEGDQVPDCEHPDLVRGAFTRAAALLHHQGTRHLLIAETNHVRDFLVACGFHEKDVYVFPYVAARTISEGVELVRRNSGEIRIGYPGGSRKVRHPELIADLLISGQFSKDERWSVQIDLNYIRKVRDEKTARAIQRLHDDGLIELHSTGLTDRDYRTMFCSLDFVVLPYSERYQQIGSGVLLEAIYAGVIPIVPQQSNMYRLYASLGGMPPAFGTRSLSAIRAAIDDGIRRRSQLKNDAMDIQRRWRRHPSAAEQWEPTVSGWLRL